MIAVRSLHSIAPEPASDGTSIRLQHRTGKKMKTWLMELGVVEYTGHYSLEKLCAFQSDTTQRMARLAPIATFAAATLPTVVIVASLELFRLENPALGWRKNATFFVQESIRGWILTVASNIQLQEIIPEMRQPWLRLMLISCLQIMPYIATLITVAVWFDVFPVPFSSLTPILPVYLVAVLIRYCFVRDALQRHPHVKPEHQRIEALVGFTFSMLIVYSIYAFAFRSVGAEYQILLSLALYGLRFAVKLRMWKLSHIQSHHDYSAESSVCGAHLFHALFATAFLQTARSYATLAVVLMLGLAQDAFAFVSLRRLSRSFSSVKQSFETDFCDGAACDPFDAAWTVSLMQHADAIQSEAERKSRFPESPIMSSRASSATHRATARSAAEKLVQSRTLASCHSPESVIQRKARVTQSLAHLMHCREVVLLHMFVDICVPAFYCAYIGFLIYLPHSNLRFYDNLIDVNEQTYSRLVNKVLVLVGLKVLAFVAVCGLLHTWRQPSGLGQLVFVVRSQWWTMQPWFILGVLQITNFPLSHKGNDLSFQFAWLKTQPRP